MHPHPAVTEGVLEAARLLLGRSLYRPDAMGELCRLVVINKIDSRDAHTERVLADVREAFGRECLPLNLPADGGRAVVDCFFAPGSATPDFSSVAAAHTEIIDQVVEVDEKLMALYLEQGEELTPE